MRRLKHGVAAVAAPGLAAALLAVGVPVVAAEDSGAARVVMSSILRNCAHDNQNYSYLGGTASIVGLISSTGDTVTADINMVTAEPNTRYEVKLIQMPRTAAAPCNPGDPGVTGGVIHTDYAGTGNVTLQSPRMSGVTGAWVDIRRPAPHSLQPTEIYTSDFIARI